MAEQKKIRCEQCKKEIPQSVAHSVEGRDYIFHFCNVECMDHFFKEHPDYKVKKK